MTNELRVTVDLQPRGPAAAIVLTDEQLATLAGERKTLPVKVTVNGSTVQAKTWLASATEPAGWDVTATVTRTASGYMGFWAGTDAAAATQRASYDAITVTT